MAIALSEIEFDCACLLIRNYNMRQIGDVLGMSPRTVESRYSDIKRKLDTKTRSQTYDALESMGLMPELYLRAKALLGESS